VLRMGNPKVTVAELKSKQKRSSYEVEFAEYLEQQRLQGKIWSYEYEPFALELAPFTLASDKTPTVYTPDFVVDYPPSIATTDKPKIYEIKGYMWSRDSVRLRWAAWRYRDQYDFFLVTKITKGVHEGEWKIKPIGAQ